MPSDIVKVDNKPPQGKKQTRWQPGPVEREITNEIRQQEERANKGWYARPRRNKYDD